MKWTILWSDTAQKQLDKLPKDDIKRILLKTDDVGNNPFAYLERLTNSDLYKFRVGMYRIIVNVVNNKLVLHMIKVKKRSRVYD